MRLVKWIWPHRRGMSTVSLNAADPVGVAGLDEAVRMFDDDLELDDWPDQDEVRYWAGVLANVAEMEQRDRGVTLRPLLRNGGDGRILWAHYDADGPWDRVAGAFADVDRDELFARIDEWIAFERDPPPEVLLDRDQAFIAQQRAALVAVMPNWARAAQLLAADIAASSDWRPEWRVVLHEVGEIPLRSEARTRMEAMGLLAPREPTRLPYVTLDDGNHEGPRLTETEDTTLARAVESIVSEFEDFMVERVWGAWPACPLHDRHPLRLDCDDRADASAVVYWACPDTGTRFTPVGALAATL